LGSSSVSTQISTFSLLGASSPICTKDKFSNSARASPVTFASAAAPSTLNVESISVLVAPASIPFNFCFSTFV